MPRGEEYEIVDCSDTELGRLVDEFTTLNREMGHGEGSLRQLDYALEFFLSILGELDASLSLSLLNDQSLSIILEKLEERGLSFGTISKIFSVINRFIRFASAKKPELAKIEKLRLSRDKKIFTAPNPIAEKDLERLYLTARANSKYKFRDLTILRLLAEYGLQATEIAALEINDHQRATSSIHVAKKRRARERIIVLSSETEIDLEAYEKDEREEFIQNGGEEEQALFLGQQGPLSNSNAAISTHIRDLAKKVLKRSGSETALDGNHIVTQLRQRAMLQILKETRSVEETAKFLGGNNRDPRLVELAKIAGVEDYHPKRRNLQGS